MRVLVTGGCGFVGSHVVHALRARGDEVVVLDDLSTGFRDAVPAEVRVVELKLGRDGAELDDLLTRFLPEVTLHFAGVSQVGESVREPGKYWQENVVGSLMLVNALVRAQPAAAGAPKLVFSSTAAVYGNPEQLPIPEDHPKRPVNPYGHSKLAVETLLADYAPLGLRSIALRYFNAAGAAFGLRERHDPETHLCPLIADVALGVRESITVFGTDYATTDGTAVRDYVHVSDLADAHLRAADYLQHHEGAHAMNLGTGSGYSVREVLAAFEAASGGPIRQQFGARRTGDPPSLVASNAKAKVELGWSPTRDLTTIAGDVLASRR